MSVEHVFVLMLENRSLDHMLGFSGIAGTDAESGQPTQLRGPPGRESNEYAGPVYPVAGGGDGPMPADPAHAFLAVVEQLGGQAPVHPRGGASPPIDDSGFAADY